MNYQKEEKKNNQQESYSRENQDLKKIFKSKIANIPTPGYSGHSSLFQKPVSYLNIDQSLEKESLPEEFDHIMDSRMSETYRLNEKQKKLDHLDLPYISGYKGFRVGVRSGNYHGANFIDSSGMARVKYLKN